MLAWYLETHREVEMPELITESGELTRLGRIVEMGTEVGFCRDPGIPARYNSFRTKKESLERVFESWWRFELERRRAEIRFRRLRDEIRDKIELLEEDLSLAQIEMGDLRRWIGEFDHLNKWNRHLRNNERDLFPEMDELYRLFLVVLHRVGEHVLSKDSYIGKWERGVAARDRDGRTKRRCDCDPTPVYHCMRPARSWQD